MSATKHTPDAEERRCLDAESPEIQRFLEAWHENRRVQFQRDYPNLDYDGFSYRKHAHTRKKFIACDSGTSGYFLVNRETAEVHSIKSYGVPNRLIGALAGLTQAYLTATAARQVLGMPGYVGTDHELALLAAAENELLERLRVAVAKAEGRE